MAALLMINIELDGFNIGITGIACTWGVGAQIIESGAVGTVTTSISSGTLPPGLTLMSPVMAVTPTDSLFIQGFTRLEGTPTTPGTYTFNVHSVDSAGNIGNISQTIVIHAAQVNQENLPRAVLLQPYSFTFDAAFIASVFNPFVDAGTIGPWTFTLTIPYDAADFLAFTNMTLVGGATDGTLSTPSFGGPNFAGQTLDLAAGIFFEFSISGFQGGMPHTLSNTAAAFISFFTFIIEIGPATPNGNVGTPYSHTFTATEPSNTEFVPVFTWNPSPSGLPPGLTFDPATATISGIPTTPGTYGGSAFGIFVSAFDQARQLGVGGIQPIDENLGYEIVIDAAPPPSGNFEGTFVGFFAAGKFGGGTL